MINKVKIGLALSGGGYRAAAFHLGVFKKLHQLNILEKVDVISSISGGSIIGTYYALTKDDFNLFELSFKKKLQQSCLKKIVYNWRFILPQVCLLCLLLFILFDPLKLNLSNWIVITILICLALLCIIFQFKIISLTRLKIEAYKKIFFGEKTICDLPTFPLLAINATNLSTGTLWTFSKNKSSDSSYEFPRDGSNSILFNCSKMSLAYAVAASTSVPVPFNPVEIPEKYFINKEDIKRVKPKLIDGGLYDNQGIHKLTQNNSSYACDIIIVSDGSQPFTDNFKSNNTFFILYRGIDVMMRKIKSLQFIRDLYSAKREIAYFSLDWRYRQCIIEFVKAAQKGLVYPSVLNYHKLDEATLKLDINLIVESLSNKIDYVNLISQGLNDSEITQISLIKTNLTSLTTKQIDLLSRHGQVLTELQIKLYCPTLIF